MFNDIFVVKQTLLIQSIMIFTTFRTLLVLCCFSLFVTSCQEDTAVTPPPAIVEEHAEVQDLLQRALTDIQQNGFRTKADAVEASYNLTLTVSEEALPGEDGAFIDEFSGTLDVSSANINTIAPEGFLFLAGDFTFEDTEGNTGTSEAVALIQPNGATYLLINDLPGISFLFIPNFALDSDFTATDLTSATDGGGFVSIDVVGELLAAGTPGDDDEPEGNVFSYELSTVGLVRVIVDSGMIGPITTIQTRLDTVDRLEGVLTIITDDFGRVSSGTYSYTTEAGLSGEASVEGFFNPGSDGIIDVVGATNSVIDELTLFTDLLPTEVNLPVSTVALGSTDDGTNLDRVTIQIELIE